MKMEMKYIMIEQIQKIRIFLSKSISQYKNFHLKYFLEINFRKFKILKIVKIKKTIKKYSRLKKKHKFLVFQLIQMEPLKQILHK